MSGLISGIIWWVCFFLVRFSSGLHLEAYGLQGCTGSCPVVGRYGLEVEDGCGAKPGGTGTSGLPTRLSPTEFAAKDRVLWPSKLRDASFSALRPTILPSSFFSSSFDILDGSFCGTGCGFNRDRRGPRRDANCSVSSSVPRVTAQWLFDAQYRQRAGEPEGGNAARRFVAPAARQACRSTPRHCWLVGRLLGWRWDRRNSPLISNEEV